MGSSDSVKNKDYEAQKSYAKRTGYAAQKAYAKRTGNAAQRKYSQKHTKVFSVKLSDTVDGDLIDYLNGIPNKAAYIRDLIRADMVAANGNTDNG